MIDKKTIGYLSALARLDLSEQEQSELLVDLNNLEKLLNRIQQVNTDGISENFFVAEDSYSRLREDKVSPSIDIKEIEKLAPLLKERKFVVPQVIE